MCHQFSLRITCVALAMTCAACSVRYVDSQSESTHQEEYVTGASATASMPAPTTYEK